MLGSVGSSDGLSSSGRELGGSDLGVDVDLKEEEKRRLISFRSLEVGKTRRDEGGRGTHLDRVHSNVLLSVLISVSGRESQSSFDARKESSTL